MPLTAIRRIKWPGRINLSSPSYLINVQNFMSVLMNRCPIWWISVLLESLKLPWVLHHSFPSQKSTNWRYQYDALIVFPVKSLCSTKPLIQRHLPNATSSLVHIGIYPCLTFLEYRHGWRCHFLNPIGKSSHYRCTGYADMTLRSETLPCRLLHDSLLNGASRLETFSTLACVPRIAWLW